MKQMAVFAVFSLYLSLPIYSRAAVFEEHFDGPGPSKFNAADPAKKSCLLISNQSLSVSPVGGSLSAGQIDLFENGERRNFSKELRGKTYQLECRLKVEDCSGANTDYVSLLWADGIRVSASQFEVRLEKSGRVRLMCSGEERAVVQSTKNEWTALKLIVDETATGCFSYELYVNNELVYQGQGAFSGNSRFLRLLTGGPQIGAPHVLVDDIVVLLLSDLVG